MEKHTIEDLHYFVDECLIEYPRWRKGQAYFNCLWDMDPELADELRGTYKDPFYKDDRIPEFLKVVEERWNKE
jgi:hypothetical protein